MGDLFLTDNEKLLASAFLLDAAEERFPSQKITPCGRASRFRDCITIEASEMFTCGFGIYLWYNVNDTNVFDETHVAKMPYDEFVNKYRN